MTILFVFGWTIQIGGHFKSALAHMRCLREMGHEVLLIAPGCREEMMREFRNIDVKVHTFSKGPKRGRFPSARGAKEIIEICREGGVDLINSQDMEGLAAGYKAAIRQSKAFVYTMAGGPVHRAFQPREVDAIYYSQELLDGMADRYNLDKNKISVIRARIDVRVYKPTKADPAFLDKYKLPRSGKKVLMAIRLTQGKRPWLENLMSFAAQAGEEDFDVHVIIAGEGGLLEHFRERAGQINARAGRQVVHMVGPVYGIDQMSKLYSHADIVVGNGRGIIEAMACRKPVVVLGENGEGALVEPENIDRVAEYNFSGRHFRYRQGTVRDSISVLKDLVHDDATLAQAGRFSLEYIKKHMDAAIGAREILSVYEKALTKKHSQIDYIKWHLRIVQFWAKEGLEWRINALRKNLETDNG